MKTASRIDRTGAIKFHDASLHIWEEGLSSRMTWDERQAWERAFKRQVFARIVRTLRRLGWTVGPQHYIFTDNNNRFCQKCDLKADLQLMGRSIKLEMFQSINCPTRPDHEGRYESNKEALMPYVMRLEMERTRRRIRKHLCNVFTGYEFEQPKISSPNPDPLAYFNDSWDGEYEKRRGIHRFKRGPDGWPNLEEVSLWNRKDHDGAQMNHGDLRWMRDQKGRLLRGRVYGGINGMWMFVYGPGQRDYTHETAKTFFTYRYGETPKKLVDIKERRKRLEQELQCAMTKPDLKRAQVVKNVLFPPGTGPLFHICVKKDELLFGPNYCGYTKDTLRAGRYTREELKPYLGNGLENDELKALEVAA